MRKMFWKQCRRRGCAAVLGLVLVVTMAGCNTSSNQSDTATKELLDPVGASIDTDTVQYRDVIVMETASGSISADKVDLQYEVSGNFVDCYVENGDYVKKGDVLAEIEQTDVQNEIDALQEQIADEEENNAYSNQLTEINLAIQTLQYQQAAEAKGADANSLQLQSLELQKAQVRYRQTKEDQQSDLDYQNARLAELQAELGETQLIAPCDGIISGIRFADYGDYISSDTVVMSLTKIDEEGRSTEGDLTIAADYENQKYINGCAEYYALINGTRYDVTYQPYTAIELEKLTYYGASFPAVFTLDDGTDGLTFGQYVQMCYVTKESLHTLAVLSNAVTKDAAGYYVLLIDEDGNRIRQDVEIGVKNQVYTEITSGVAEGDVVYVQN